MTVYVVKIPACPGVLAFRNSKENATFVQAWEYYDGRKYVGTVYTQEMMLLKIKACFEVYIVTIIRYDNGEREYHKGSLAASVARNYETKE